MLEFERSGLEELRKDDEMSDWIRAFDPSSDRVLLASEPPVDASWVFCIAAAIFLCDNAVQSQKMRSLNLRLYSQKRFSRSE